MVGGSPTSRWIRYMGPNSKEPEAEKRFEIGDEVIGDEHVRGTIIRVKDLHQVSMGHREPVREYLVKNEKGERMVYTGELNLQLVKKGLGDTAPPRPEFLRELDEDLVRRPLSGIRL
jgi:hypothetical protein